MRVAIHFNLRTKLWVMSDIKTTRNGERKAKVIKNDLTQVSLTNVHWVDCPESTRQRIIANTANPKSKAGREVCAYAIGTLAEFAQVDGDRISMNPHKATYFYLAGSLTRANAHYDNVSFNNRREVHAK